MTLKLDVQTPMNLPAPQQVEHIQRMEDIRFDGAGLADHMEHGRDVYSVLAMAAAQTKRIQLFPCVTNPVTRHPWVLANVAHSMDEMAPGRFKLIMGAGDTAVMHVGKKPARVATMRQAVSDIRGLLRGEGVTFGDRADEQIIGIKEPAPAVVVAVGGERMTEVAGELGDEAFLLTGIDDRVLAMSRRHLQAGAARSGRSLDGFKVTHYTIMRIENDPELAREFARSRMFGWIKQGFFRGAIDELGITLPSLESPEDIPSEAVDVLGEALFIIGPVEKITERLQQMSNSCVDRVVCVISGPEGPDAALDALARQIMPKVK